MHPGGVPAADPLRLAPRSPHHAGLCGDRAGRLPVYHFRDGGPNPGHTWWGLFRNLTLTQIYTDNYAFALLHQGFDPDVEPGRRGGVLRRPAGTRVVADGAAVLAPVAAGAAAGRFRWTAC